MWLQEEIATSFRPQRECQRMRRSRSRWVEEGATVHGRGRLKLALEDSRSGIAAMIGLGYLWTLSDVAASIMVAL